LKTSSENHTMFCLLYTTKPNAQLQKLRYKIYNVTVVLNKWPCCGCIVHFVE